ncbi:MAG: putative Cupin 2 conserved barrel domain protein, precursor [Chloroflexi bacterium]|nr:putative Cupin 2 conserved barrel domain protein, precursor [Chloroflexota bacterium]
MKAQIDANTLRRAIQEQYADRAEHPHGSFHFHSGQHLLAIPEYPRVWTEHIRDDDLASFDAKHPGLRSQAADSLGPVGMNRNKRRVSAMKLFAILSVVAFALAGTPPSIAQELPPGVRTVMASNFGPTERPGQFQVIQLLMELPPSTATPPHSHGGRAYVTVLEGEASYWEGDQEGRYEAGAMWIEEPGVPGTVVNTGDVTVRLLVTFLLPTGAQLTTLVDR